MIEVTKSIKQLTKKRILLTEDDPIALKVHTVLLEKIGFVVDIAKDGNEAKEKYNKNYTEYKLAVLDARLPYLDGFDLAKYIREYEMQNGILRMPLIVISAEPMKDLITKCGAADIDDFAQKPVTELNLRTLIMKYINSL